MGKLRASIKGDALYGTVCGRDYTLTLTTADQFGNPRCAAHAFPQGTLVSRPRSTMLPHRQTLALTATQNHCRRPRNAPVKRCSLLGCMRPIVNAQHHHCRSEGGDKVEAVLRHADGKHEVRAAVVDNTNGAYSLAFRLELQGEWRLAPNVNGADIEAAAIKVCPMILVSLPAAPQQAWQARDDTRLFATMRRSS